MNAPCLTARRHSHIPHEHLLPPPRSKSLFLTAVRQCLSLHPSGFDISILASTMNALSDHSWSAQRDLGVSFLQLCRHFVVSWPWFLKCVLSW